MSEATGAFYENVLITILTVVTFITLVLAFMYLIFVKEEPSKTKTSAAKT